MTRPLPRLLILLALIALAGCKAEDSSPIAPGTGGTDAGGSTTVGPGTDVDLSGGQDVPALPKQCDLAIDCPAERPFCDLASGQCLECLDDSSCSAAAKCEGGTCVLQASCIPGEKTCNGEELWTCKADGSGWDTQPCPSVCFALGEARCLECEPGSKRCFGDVLQLCQPDGSSWVDLQTCEGSCVVDACQTCRGGDKQCDDDRVQLCAADGSAWVDDIDCSAQGEGQVCFKGTCVDPCNKDLKFSTNVGCEYWAVDLDQALVETRDTDGNLVGRVLDAQNAPFAIVVANVGDQRPATVTVFRDGTELTSATLPPRGLHIFDSLEPHNVDGTMKGLRSYRIDSTRPIVAYQFNPLDNEDVFSNDASLLLPYNSLGRDYRALGWPSRGQFRSYLTIVATREQTEVTVTVSAPTSPGPGGVPALDAGQSVTLELVPFEVLSLSARDSLGDLSGSEVHATKRVAVFSGGEASHVPATTPCVNGTCVMSPSEHITCAIDADCPIPCCGDHLEQQLFPRTAWGKTYIGARSKPRAAELEMWRVMALEPDTTVTLSPGSVASVPTLGAGEFHDFQTLRSFVLTADKPVLLGQFLVAEKGSRPDFGGECMDPRVRKACSITGKTCSNDTECGVGEACGNSVCVALGPPCVSVDDCNPGFICNTSDGRCVRFDEVCNDSGPCGNSDALCLSLQRGRCSLNQLQTCNSLSTCIDSYHPDDPNIGDPAFILGVPVEQLREDYIFLVPDKYAQNFITVYAPAGVSVQLDAQSLDAHEWTDVSDGWRVLHLPVGPGVHDAVGTGTFGVTVYGYDRFVSYGYPAGMNVTDLNAEQP